MKWKAKGEQEERESEKRIGQMEGVEEKEVIEGEKEEEK